MCCLICGQEPARSPKTFYSTNESMRPGKHVTESLWVFSNQILAIYLACIRVRFHKVVVVSVCKHPVRFYRPGVCFQDIFLSFNANRTHPYFWRIQATGKTTFLCHVSPEKPGSWFFGHAENPFMRNDLYAYVLHHETAICDREIFWRKNKNSEPFCALFFILVLYSSLYIGLKSWGP